MIDLADALDVAEMAVALKRAVPANRWVADLRAEAEAASLAALF